MSEIKSYLNNAKCSKEKWNRIFPKRGKSSPEIKHVCQDCGTKKGWRQHQISTWYQGHCDVCGEDKIVTEFRDFFYGK